MIPFQLKIVALFFFIANQAYATIELNPGLWQVKAILHQDGKTIDPQAKMRESLAKMSPEQRKQMNAVMNKFSAHMSEDGTQVCYTQDFLNRQSTLPQKHTEDCSHEISKNSSKHMVVNFKCKNGSSGTGEWTFQDRSHYTGKMKLVSSSGKPSEIDYTGTRLSSDCGGVQPLQINENK